MTDNIREYAKDFNEKERESKCKQPPQEKPSIAFFVGFRNTQQQAADDEKAGM